MIRYRWHRYNNITRLKVRKFFEVKTPHLIFDYLLGTSTMQNHWENIYKTKDTSKVSWYQETPTASLDLISRATKETDRLIDIGGGASSLWHNLIDKGYSNISVLDISNAALEIARSQQPENAKNVEWIVTNVLDYNFPNSYYSIWHDRAVFHFLNSDAEKKIYVHQAAKAIKPGGVLIVGTFSIHGPQQCSNLPVSR